MKIRAAGTLSNILVNVDFLHHLGELAHRFVIFLMRHYVYRNLVVELMSKTILIKDYLEQSIQEWTK